MPLAITQQLHTSIDEQNSGFFEKSNGENNPRRLLGVLSQESYVGRK
jgi:hypothetical protein